MFEVFSEVRATLSPNFIATINGGSILDTIRHLIATATIEEVIINNCIQYQLCGTLDGILIAKTRLEKLLNGQHMQLGKEPADLDSTTLSEENSSVADEENTSCDKDKTSCLSDDKEQETNASSNGYMSTTTESSFRTLPPKQPLSKKLRLLFKERPRLCQRRGSALLAQKLRASKKSQRRNNPEWLSENLQQMKLCTEDSDLDSTDGKVKSAPARKPCNTRNYDVKTIAKLSCDLCSFKTKRSSQLTKHMAIHTKSLHSCPHCSYQTVKKRYYDRHLRLHCHKRGATAVHSCLECGYRTHRKEHLQRHVKSVHGGERPHLCKVCGKAFKRNDALLQHNLVHSEIIRDHKCTVCGKRFRSQSHLLEHLTVHSEQRDFLCELCGATFKTRSVHRKHMQNIHRVLRTYPCDLCTKKFNTQYTLKRHRLTHAVKKKAVNDLSASENNSDVPGIPYNSPQSASESDGVPCLPVSASNPVAAFPMGELKTEPRSPVVFTTTQPTLLFINNNVP